MWHTLIKHVVLGAVQQKIWFHASQKVHLGANSLGVVAGLRQLPGAGDGAVDIVDHVLRQLVLRQVSIHFAQPQISRRFSDDTWNGCSRVVSACRSRTADHSTQQLAASVRASKPTP